MTDLPNPLTPADCDLRDFAYMPLDVLRLRDSDLAARLTGEEFRCAVLLWCAAWHQVPAGSLPDDDVNLAQYAGFGRTVEEWRKVRGGALWGWLKCSDGRLYHPVVSEKANEAWVAKHRQAHDKLCERVRKRNKGRPENGLTVLEVPEFEQWLDAGRPSERSLFPAEFSSASGGKTKSSGGKPDDFRRKDTDVPPETPHLSAGNPDSSGGNIDDFQRKLTTFPAEGFGSNFHPQDAGAEKLGKEEGKNAFRDSSAGNSEISGGNEDFSAGNDGDFRRKPPTFPPENALKGEERRGEVNTYGSNSGDVPPPAREEHAPLAAVDVSKSLREWERERGKFPRNITPSQEQVIELADCAPTPQELRKAYELAVAEREAASDPGPINAGFIRTMLDRVRRPPKPKREPQVSPWAMSDVQLNTLGRELGIGGARAGESREAYIARIQLAQAEKRGEAA